MTSEAPAEPAPYTEPKPKPSVAAEFFERKRIVFTARERAFVNVREAVADGPVGFTSTELLLIAIGNCSLGTLTNHELLKDAELSNLRATFIATMAPDPARVVRIETHVTADVTDPDLLKREGELEQIACMCPMCNSVSAEKAVTVRLRLKPRD